MLQFHSAYKSMKNKNQHIKIICSKHKNQQELNTFKNLKNYVHRKAFSVLSIFIAKFSSFLIYFSDKFSHSQLSEVLSVKIVTNNIIYFTKLLQMLSIPFCWFLSDRVRLENNNSETPYLKIVRSPLKGNKVFDFSEWYERLTAYFKFSRS